MKPITILAGLAAATLLLVGCSSTSTPTPEPVSPDPNPTVEEFGVFQEDSAQFDLSEPVPFVSEVINNSFLLVDGGSSSCPNEIESIVYETAGNVVAITYATPPADMACTADFTLSANRITFNEASITDTGTVKFTLDGVNVPVKDTAETV